MVDRVRIIPKSDDFLNRNVGPVLQAILGRYKKVAE